MCGLAVLPLLIAGAARGQCIPLQGQSSSEPCTDAEAPVITLSPDDGGFTQRAVPVRIDWSDESYTNAPQIRLNGTDISASFSAATRVNYLMAVPTYIGLSTGSIRLQDGVNTLLVTVCDNRYQCGTASSTFRFGAPGVSVTPDGGGLVVNMGTAGARVVTVTNTGIEAAVFDLKAKCVNQGTPAAFSGACTLSAASVALAAGQSASVTVSYTAWQVGALGLLQVSAAQRDRPGVEDAGWTDVTVGAPGSGSGDPVVSIADVSAGASIERSLCVTVAAGGGAAYECGDLRLAHALAPARTLNRVRAPVLLYNSQHAHPRPLVYANVTLPAGAAPPDFVYAAMTLPTLGFVNSKRVETTGWASGTTRRIAIGFDGATVGTGVYPFTLDVTIHTGTADRTARATGELVVVNRAQSPFGAGWWVAGLEQLYFPSDTTQRLWVGGDGSTRVYRKASAGRWAAEALDEADSLVWTGNGYARLLRNGARVEFAANGQHTATANRFGQRTSFLWNGSCLSAILVPYSHTAQTTGASLAGCPSSTFTARDGRVVTLVRGAGDSRITAITDPDGRQVQFAYADASDPMRITARTDRNGGVVRFGYDASGRLASASADLQDGRLLTQGFEAAESKGDAAAVPLAESYTRLDGPRADVNDVTLVWVNRWGAPARVRDALGHETQVYREDARWPALVTRMVATNGLETRATYDGRGRLLTSTVQDPLGAGTGTATTTYTWDAKWDLPATITAPTGVVTRMNYDALTGNPLWQEVGDSTRRVYYGYNAEGQPAWVRTPDQAVDSLAYDVLGNLVRTRTPLGFLTLYYQDGSGRDTLVVTPTTAASATSVAGVLQSGVRQRTEWDSMHRPVLVETIGPAITHQPPGTGVAPPPSVAEKVSVRTVYDNLGRPLSVQRWATPDTAHVGVLTTTYTYDAAGRKLTEASTGAATQTFTYDAASNLTRWTKGDTLRTDMEYDAVNRLTHRITPEVRYGYGCANQLATCRDTFPKYPNNTARGLTIAEDHAWFGYDDMGRLVWAENGDAVVQRSYYPNGALRRDSLWLRDWSGSAFTQAYGLEYGYDLAGRLRSLRHPTNLTGPTQQTDQFDYDPATSVLSGVTDRLGNAFSFAYDALGRPVKTTMPGGIVDTATFDIDGRQLTRWEGSALLGTLNSEVMQYDARGKLMVITTPQTDFRQWYTGLGNLAATDWSDVFDFGRSREDFVTDALGTVAAHRTWDGVTVQPDDRTPWFQNTYDSSIGRLRIAAKLPPSTLSPFAGDSTNRSYDTAGNMSWGQQKQWGPIYNGDYQQVRQMDSRSYYAADGKLRVFQSSDQNTDGHLYTLTGVWEEYRYDPLGRRVLVRANRDDLCASSPEACRSSITRYVWAADQLLWELKAPGASTDNLEATSGTGPEYGQVSYTHAGGIDRPLVIAKGTTVLITHQNWRGMFSRGTKPNGTLDCPQPGASDCVAVAWPGWSTTAWLAKNGRGPQTNNWFGSLSSEQRDASGQLYRRARYYDPLAGQFTQSDPIGLAGGLSSYGFAAGDPISYDDPYGLTVCFNGTRNERRSLEIETERAIGAQIDVGIDGCVTSVGKSASPARDRFNSLVRSAAAYSIAFGGPTGSYFDALTRTVWIDAGEVATPFYALEEGECRPGIAKFSFIARLLAHELGHAYDADRKFGRIRMMLGGRRNAEYSAMQWENLWARQNNQPERCRYGAEF